MRFLTLIFIFALPCVGNATATVQALKDTLKLGAVLPLTGAEQEAGRIQQAALRASGATLAAKGLTLELIFADSRSDPDESARQAQGLIGAGVHALVCCSTPQTLAAVAPYADAAHIPLLSLSSPVYPGPQKNRWLFSLAPAEAAQLGRLTLEAPLHPFALMAPVGPSGDHARDALSSMRVGVARYAPGQTPLTPEALWIATREPGSVVVWDDGPGTVQAAEALVARGYTGRIIVQAAIWDGLGALERARLTGALSVLSPAVLGYTLADAHPSKGTVASFRRALIGVPRGDLSETTLAQGASAWDAAQLFGGAAEQLIVYGLELSRPETVRRAVRDALLGLEPLIGAGGTYDFSEGQQAGPQPGSLVLGTWRSGFFRPQ